MENNSICLLPGEAALENASRGGAAQDDPLKNGPDNSGLELLDLSPENLQRQVSKVPSNWVWCCAAGEISCVQVLVPFKDVFIGGMKEHVTVPKNMPLEQKQVVPLATKLKVWVAFPLNTKWSYLIFGIRPGSANKDEEIALNLVFLDACRRHPGFVVLAADGATKERSHLRSVVVNTWK